MVKRRTVPATPASRTGAREAWLPLDSSGRYAVHQTPRLPLDDAIPPTEPALKRAPVASTRPEMPAVRAKAASCPLPPVSALAGASPTALTTPEMAAVRPEAGRSSFPSLPPYEDEGITTEVARRTDFGAPPSQPTERNRAVLLRMDGVNAGQVASVAVAPLTIGRHPSNALSIQDGGISRSHARIVHEQGVHWIEDVGSRNGTYVQGRRVTRCSLNDGDWIQLGPRVSFRFSITDARQEGLLRQLYKSSTRDALTGAYNRQHFDERLRTEVTYAVRHSTEVSLVLFDLDHFKQVNDSYGHLAGDAVLRSVAATVSARLRAEDVFARYGGEEFAVVLRGIDLAGAARVGERLRRAIARSVVSHQGLGIRVTISVGCTALQECSRPTGVDLVGLADRRLYVAKDSGRDRVVAGD